MVRMSSSGDMKEETNVRASIPEQRGTAGAGRSGGSVTFRRWSYVSMYAVDDGTPITLKHTV